MHDGGSLTPQQNHSNNISLTPCLKAPKSRHTNVNYNTFKKSLQTYALFHSQQIEKMKSGDSSIRTLSYVCNNPIQCHGIGDQFYRIQQVLLLAI